VCALSFAPTTLGAQAIGDLKVGDQVIAYDTETGASSSQTVQHVWINHDNNLLDVTLSVNSSDKMPDTPTSVRQTGPHSRHGDRSSPDDVADDADASATDTELVHTTDNHPWLTADRGRQPACELRLGERVVQLDGKHGDGGRAG
jgi:hypothetical protein